MASNIAHIGLTRSAEPLNMQDMMAAMGAKVYWSTLGGKTPQATLCCAILRDLAKGDTSRFVKAERGLFAVRS